MDGDGVIWVRVVVVGMASFGGLLPVGEEKGFRGCVD